ncbi:hypothetical protein V8F20_004738 [Naviculisporaceae sp. PSN 640]
MPNYEPTPRRFSTISVPQTPSRRNSFDNINRPSLAVTDGLAFPSLASPLDLSAVLKRLQQTQDHTSIEKTDGEDDERGRSRQSAGHRRSATAWSHHGSPGIQIPSARKRENSASTRERIAMWEERSRSQSKGRSKSRGRDLGHRVSIVPEVPELPSNFAVIGSKEETEVNESEENDDGHGRPTTSTEAALHTLEGYDSRPVNDQDSDLKAASGDEPLNTSVLNESLNDKADAVWNDSPVSGAIQFRGAWNKETSPVQQSQHDARRRAGNKAHSPPQSPQLAPISTNYDQVDNLDDERPQTPVRTIPGLLPTPDATPRQMMGVDDTQSGVPASPRSDFGKEVEEAASIEAKTIDSECKTTSQDVKKVRVTDPVVTANELHKTRTLPVRHAPSTDKTQKPRTSYHDVWKIADYAPEFPLPARPTVQTTLDHATLARAPFEGTPLQELPRSQLSRATEAYLPPPESTTETRRNPYPYSASRHWEEGSWSVEIPPSPTSAYQRPPDDYRPARQARRRSRSRSRSQRNEVNGGKRVTFRGGDLESGRRHEWDTPPVIERAFHAASVSFFQGLSVPMGLYRGFRDIYYPPPVRPDIIKAYPVRRKLPIRIFFPSHHDLTSPARLPTLFTIHGGGFTVGYASDDDKWNRTFADTYTVMLISLNYSKAPWACFPAPLHDTEALYHAVLNDESLPIDRMRTALCGFDAGANLALALSQLPSVKSGRDPNPPRFPPPAAINHTSSPMSPTTTGSTDINSTSRNLNRHRSMYFSTGAPLPQGYRPNTHPGSHPYYPPPLKSHPPPSAVIPICGILDFTTPASIKSHTRPYKRSLKGPRGWGLGFDWMGRLLPSSAWSYIPYGHDTSDPLLSPVFAKREDLPPHVFVIGAELDCLAHESWRAACSWAGGDGGLGAVTAPDNDTIVGRRGVSRWRGCLDDGEGLDGSKFGWVSYHRRNGTGAEDEEGEIMGSTRWLLVPDVVHGFDSAPWRNKYLWGDEEARMDAEMKTIAYQREMAEWLWGVVWK